LEVYFYFFNDCVYVRVLLRVFICVCVCMKVCLFAYVHDLLCVLPCVVVGVCLCMLLVVIACVCICAHLKVFSNVAQPRRRNRYEYSHFPGNTCANVKEEKQRNYFSRFLVIFPNLLKNHC